MEKEDSKLEIIDHALTNITGSADRLREAYDKKEIHNWKYANELHVIYSAILRARSALASIGIVVDPQPKTLIPDWTKLCDNALRYAYRSRLYLEQIKDLLAEALEPKKPTKELEGFINATIKTLEELKNELTNPTEGDSEAGD